MNNLKLKSSLIVMPTCLALLVSLSACTVSKPTNKSLVPIKTEIIEPEQKTSIFTYYVDPIHQAQPAAIVRGNFVWSNHCLYLIGSNRKFTTAMFPEFPKGIVKWDEATKTVSINGRVFKMSDYIKTNGAYLPYHPNTPGGAEYEKQGDKKCLTPTIALIGTFFD